MINKIAIYALCINGDYLYKCVMIFELPSISLSLLEF